VYGRHEGVRTSCDFVFGHAEIAACSCAIGEGMSLREASRELRLSVLRHGAHAAARERHAHPMTLGTLELAIALNRYDRHVPFFNATVAPPRGVRFRALEIGESPAAASGANRRPGDSLPCHAVPPAPVAAAARGPLRSGRRQ
jgi:hypothetical protein